MLLLQTTHISSIPANPLAREYSTFPCLVHTCSIQQNEIPSQKIRNHTRIHTHTLHKDNSTSVRSKARHNFCTRVIITNEKRIQNLGRQHYLFFSLVLKNSNSKYWSSCKREKLGQSKLASRMEWSDSRQYSELKINTVHSICSLYDDFASALLHFVTAART